MSHHYIHFGTIIARGSRTRGSNVAFSTQRPFGPVSGSNVACGSSILYLTREGLCDTYICRLGSIQFQKQQKTVKKVPGP